MSRRQSNRSNSQRRGVTVYDVITDRILAQLEAGTVPWTKPWSGEAGMPRNLVSGKAYRGVNVFMLAMLGYESPFFVTFKEQQPDLDIRVVPNAAHLLMWDAPEAFTTSVLDSLAGAPGEVP